MNGTDFTTIAARYERDSLIQKSAAERLIGLLEIGPADDVLDLGCGTGNLTRTIRALAGGKVAGVDSSKGMIGAAAEKKDGAEIEFRTGAAEDLADTEAFSVIFCNSAFQWFRDPAAALANCHRALRPGGRMGIQAPAKKAYCPNFLDAIDAAARDPRTAKTFSGFRPPWIFLETAEEYSALFRRAGFSVPFAVIEEIKTVHSPDEVMTIFESGAAAGYLNREFYRDPIDEAYTAAFRETVRDAFRRQAGRDGNVGLLFNRIYLVAVK